MHSIRRRGVERDEHMPLTVERSKQQEIHDMMETVRRKIRSRHSTLFPSAQAACRAFLAYYVAKSEGLEPAEIVKHAQSLARGFGLDTLPPMEAKLVSKLNLEGYVEEM